MQTDKLSGDIRDVRTRRVRFWMYWIMAVASTLLYLLFTATMLTVPGILPSSKIMMLTAVGTGLAIDMVIAIDLSRSVADVGPDGRSDFQKNVDGVTRLLAQVPPGAHVTVIGITDRSFAQPYLLMQARIPADTGYFGQRLTAARNQAVRAWKLRSVRLEPHFRQTDILGALRLAGQIFAQQPGAGQKKLILFSDMRQSTPELSLEQLRKLPASSMSRITRDSIPPLRGVHVYVLGVDGAGKSSAYWQGLQTFWRSCFSTAGATVESYSVLRDMR